MSDRKKLAGIFVIVILVNVFGILIVNKTNKTPDDVVEFTGPRNFVEEMEAWYEENLHRSNETLRLHKKEMSALKVYEDFTNRGPQELTEKGLADFLKKSDELYQSVEAISKERKKYMDVTPMPRPDN